MKKILITILCSCLVISFVAAQSDNEKDFNERSLIALRAVGHQLMMANNDSTSIIKPIKRIDQKTYELSFDSQLAIHPNEIIDFTQKSIAKYNLPQHYRVQVFKCNDTVVAYSYEIARKKETDIVPCKWRSLPKACYTIQLSFIKDYPKRNNSAFWIIPILFLITLALIWLYKRKKALPNIPTKVSDNVVNFGTFKFYPEELKLIKQSVEIELSKKECELLSILVEKPNQTVTRDELSKRVWEDHGVVVGRSLDTYISKLRKKLKDDNSVQIINIHGVGYKLVIEANANS